MSSTGKTLPRVVASLAIASAAAATALAAEGREGDAMDPAIQPDYAPYRWPDAAPADLPVPRSKDLPGITFTGRYANYTGADTWYPTWAPDGNLYSPWTDGYIWTRRAVSPHDCSYCDRAYAHLNLPKRRWAEGDLKPYHCHSNVGPTATGQAKIVGDDPLNLGIEVLGKMYSGHELYPCVSLVADGVFYIGTYQAFADGGPFNGFRHSRDWDHFAEALQPNWTNPHWTDTRTEKTDFFKRDANPRRFRVPHAVFFGQDNALSPDGRIYLSAHGALPGGRSTWNVGDAIYLCRVDSDPTKVADPDAYEFFAGHDPAGRPLWSNDVTQSQPILAWRDRLGSESITYVPGLKRYLLTTARAAEGNNVQTGNNLAIWEADDITGPYRLVHYLENWGPQTYFPNIPAKFISPDGRRLWLCVSSNFESPVNDPYQCRYAMSLHELILDRPGEPLPNLTRAGTDVAPKAKQEASAGQVKLTWPEPQRIDRVRLYDRPNLDDWVHAATLTFDDGSTEKLRAWTSNAAKAPSEVSFAPKTVRSLTIRVDESLGANPGFSRVEVYTAGR